MNRANSLRAPPSGERAALVMEGKAPTRWSTARMTLGARDFVLT
jgi:hypothetical protein